MARQQIHGQDQIKDGTNDADMIVGVDVDDSLIGDGKVLVYRTASGDLEYETPPGAGGANEKVKVSANDTTEDYLINKLTSQGSIGYTEIGDGGDEDLRLDVVEAQVDHGGLGGLTPDDDHTQYLLVAGTRAMTGALDMGAQSITDIDELILNEQATVASPASGKGTIYVKDDSRAWFKNDGGQDFDLTVSADGKLYVSADDTTRDYLLNKLVAGSTKLSIVETNPGGDEDITLDVVEANISHDNIGGVSVDDHHAQLHASDHSDGGGDEIDVEDLAATSVITSNALKPDGLGGVAMGDMAHSELTGVGVDDHHNEDHEATHVVGGADPFLTTDLLDAIAKTKVRKNSGGVDVGARRRLNFIEGSGITLTITDDSPNEEIDITIVSTGGGDELVKVSADDTTAGYLLAKILGGEGLSIQEIGGGGDEDLQIDMNITELTEELTPASGDMFLIWDGASHKKVDFDNMPGGAADDKKVKVSTDDTTPDFLLAKLAEGNGITLAEVNPGANEDVSITVDEADLSLANLGTRNHGSLSDAPEDAHHTKLHATTHSDAGTDEITVENLATASVDNSNVLQADGLGGLEMADLAHADLSDAPTDAHHTEAHVLAVTGPHTGELPFADLAAGTQGSIIRRGAADWEEYALGTEDYVLKATATDVAWGQVDWSELSGVPSPVDADAIHDNVAGEINAITEKASPVGADVIVIEDSAGAGWTKKKVQITNLPAGSPSFGIPTGNIDIGDSAIEGTSGDSTRADHQHAFTAPGAGYPQDVAATESDGTATTPARSDHVHAHGSGYSEDAHHTKLHSSTHDDGGTDEISVEGLATASVDTSTALRPDGLGGLAFSDVDWGDLTGIPSPVDADAIHDNVADEINQITVKGSPVGADVLVIEDSAASWAKKKITITSLGATDELVSITGSDTTAGYLDSKLTVTEGVQKAVQNPGGAETLQLKMDVNGLTEELTPASGDFFVLYDGVNHKKVDYDNMPGGGAHAASHHSGGADEVYFSQLEQASGDPTLHNAYTTTPHVSSAEKTTWNGKMSDLSDDSSPTLGGNFSSSTYRMSVLTGQLALPSGTSFPGTPLEGDCFYRTDEDKFYIYDGTVWDEISGGGLHASTHIAGGADEIATESLDDINNGSQMTTPGSLNVAWANIGDNFEDICYQLDLIIGGAQWYTAPQCSIEDLRTGSDSFTIQPSEGAPQPSGSSDNADMYVAEFDATDDEMYVKTTGNADNQNLYLYFAIQVPEDFSAWATNAIIVTYKVSDGTGNTGVVVTVYDTAGTLDDTSSKGQSTSESTITILGSALGGTYTKGSCFVVRLECVVDSADDAYAGKVKVAYTTDRSLM
jgi:hypothetical protein